MTLLKDDDKANPGSHGHNKSGKAIMECVELDTVFLLVRMQMVHISSGPTSTPVQA
jgi:hypothetical protein